MRRARIPVTIGLAWLLCVAGAVGWTLLTRAAEEQALVTRFQGRAVTEAAFISAYVGDVLARGERVLLTLDADPSVDGVDGHRHPVEGRLAEAANLAGFDEVLLVDRGGQIEAAYPSADAPVQVPLLQRYPHLGEALAGRQAVSGVVPSVSQGTPVVSFALPRPSGEGALSVAHTLDDSPLRPVVDGSVEGTRAFVVDDAGSVVLRAGEGGADYTTGRSLPVAAAVAAPVREDGQVTVAARIEGTPWLLVLDASEAAVVGPLANSSRWWWWLVGLSLLGLGVAVMAARALTLRSRARQQSLDADRRFRLTVEYAPIGMTMVGLDHRLVRPNSKLCLMLGYSAAELEGMTFEHLTHADDVERDLRLLEELVEGAIPHYEMEKRYIRKDGSEVWGRLTVSMVRDGAGRPSYFVGQIEDVTEMLAAQAALERRALHDPLTGLANRSLLIERLGHALASRAADRGVAVAFCDLDRFKRINDTKGHLVGDSVLKEVATRLSRSVRGGDTVARMGGDEFVVLLGDVRSAAEAHVVLDRARRAVEQPITLGDQVLSVGFSAGLAVAESYDTADTLLRNADAALYLAKDRGRGRSETYDPQMGGQVLTELSLETELRDAAERDEFELHYQPVLELATGQTVAYEALVRWRHPVRGLLFPAEFIAVAEQAGLIGDLGACVLRQACDFLARHPDQTWQVWVNVSPLQLAGELAPLVEAELDSRGVPARRLAVEITESGVLEAADHSLAQMQRLRERGIDILIDDFGTGYSALSSVLTTPVSGLKLDRSFTARLGEGDVSDRITFMLAGLVDSIGLVGVAEGIETLEQAEQALAYGWQYGQGYHFAMPVPESHLGLDTPPPLVEERAHAIGG